MVLCLVSIVTAQNVTFSTLGQTGPEDILIYTFNGTDQVLYGMWNTSSAYVPLPVTDFNVVVRPSAINRLSNPGSFLNDAFAYISTNILPIIIIMFLFGLAWRKK